ncbi:MAG: radical SAM protein [Candidatus Omnitrophica bacterium]|nr:radical SAM protein [Candidatus Omnitrophota bacterium]
MNCPQIPLVPCEEFFARALGKFRKSRIPMVGAFEPTLRCNLRCKHCYCCFDPKKKELSPDEIGRIIDEVAAAGCIWLTLTGGEPLLRPDFLEIYTHAKKKGMLVSLFTNATLITPEIADYFLEYPPHEIEISLYGATKETYENVTGVAGSFERCMQGIRLLHERKLRFLLKTMVMTLNRHELGAMNDFANGLGVDFHFDPVLNPKIDGSREPCDYRIDVSEAASLDVNDGERLKAWKDYCTGFENFVPDDKLYVCGAGRESFHIDPYGNLGVCVLSRSEDFNLKNDSFRQGWDEFMPKLLSPKRTKGYACERCDLQYLCTVCPSWSKLETQDIEKPVEYLCQLAHLRAEALGIKKGGGRWEEKLMVSRK